MKLTNKSEGGLALNNITAYTLVLEPKSSLVFSNGQLVKGYQKVLDIFKDTLDFDLAIEQEEKVVEKAKVAEQPKKVEEVAEITEDTVEETESTETEEGKVAKPKKATKKDK